jgi:hypothetical protein
MFLLQFACRIVIALVFASSAVGKASLWLFDRQPGHEVGFGMAFDLSLASVELALGIWLILDRRRASATAATLLILGFVLWMVRDEWIHGPESTKGCGCFGAHDFERDAHWLLLAGLNLLTGTLLFAGGSTPVGVRPLEPVPRS